MAGNGEGDRKDGEGTPSDKSTPSDKGAASDKGASDNGASATGGAPQSASPAKGAPPIIEAVRAASDDRGPGPRGEGRSRQVRGHVECRPEGRLVGARSRNEARRREDGRQWGRRVRSGRQARRALHGPADSILHYRWRRADDRGRFRLFHLREAGLQHAVSLQPAGAIRRHVGGGDEPPDPFRSAAQVGHREAWHREVRAGDGIDPPVRAAGRHRRRRSVLAAGRSSRPGR